MVEVVWTSRARKDLDGISAFIAQSSPYYAEKTEIGIFQRSLVLEEHPRVGHPVVEIGDPDIREITEGDYRIIYWLVSDERVSVIAVMHNRRRLPPSFTRTRRRTK